MRHLYHVCEEQHVPFIYDIVLGNVHDWIALKAQRASFLALGRRGRQHIGDAEHLGEHYKALSPRLSIPLLIGGRSSSPLRRLLLAFDGSWHARVAFHWTDVRQRSLGADVIVLTIAEHGAQELARRAKGQLAPASRARYRFEPHRGKPAVEIVCAVAEMGTDLLLMGKGHRRRTLLHPFAGHLLPAVLRATDIPVFVT